MNGIPTETLRRTFNFEKAITESKHEDSTLEIRPTH
jgi:hypothetical protein